MTWPPLVIWNGYVISIRQQNSAMLWIATYVVNYLTLLRGLTMICQGFTPLHLATDRGHTHVVRFLLESGADKSIQDTEGATALDTARILENQDLILILED